MQKDEGKEFIDMEQGDQIIRAFCYASFSANVTPIRKDTMTQFANAVTALKVEKSFIDKNHKKAAKNRPNWNAMLEECDAENVRHIVIPALAMLDHNIGEAIEVVKEMQRKYGLSFYFVYEDISTGNNGDNDPFIPYLMMMDYEISIKDRKKSLERGFAPFWEHRMKATDGRTGAVGYFAFKEEKKMRSNEYLQQYLTNLMSGGQYEIRAVFSDLVRKGRFAGKEGWANAVLACEDESVSLFVVSTIDALGDDVFDVISFTNYAKEKYGVDTYFLQEDLLSTDQSYSQKLAQRSYSIEQQKKQKRRRAKMKSVYQEITEGV